MKIQTWLFALIKEHTPIPEEELAQLHKEIDTDIALTITDKAHADYKPGIKATIFGWFRGPWARLGLAISYIPVSRWIYNYKNSRNEPESEEEEETED